MNAVNDLNVNNLSLIQVKSSVNKYLNYCNLIRETNKHICLSNIDKNALNYKKFISKSEVLEDLNILFNIIYRIYSESAKFGGDQTFRCIEKNMLYEIENIEAITCWDFEQLISRQIRFIEDKSIMINQNLDILEKKYDEQCIKGVTIINMRKSNYSKCIGDYDANSTIILDIRGYAQYIMDCKFNNILDFIYSLSEKKAFVLIDNKTRGLGESLVFIASCMKNIVTMGESTASINKEGVYEKYILPNSKIEIKIKVKSFKDVLENECREDVFKPDISCDATNALKKIKDILGNDF